MDVGVLPARRVQAPAARPGPGIDYSSTVAPYFPADVCGVTSHAFGALATGAPHNDYGTSGCFQGAVNWYFNVNPDDDIFQNGSLLCGTVSWGGQTSGASCVTIHN